VISNKSSTFISGLLAIGIYLLLLFTLLFYFNSRSNIKALHYVKKNEDKIRVTLASEPIKSKIKEPAKKPNKPKIEEPKISKPIPQKKETVKKAKDRRKKVIKEKIVKKVKPKKKPEEKPKVKPKKVNAPKSLFDNVKTSKKPKEKPKKEAKPKPQKSKPMAVPKKESASKMLSESMKKQKSSESGVEDAYLTSVQNQLYSSWNTKSEYAGETAMVRLWIKPNGKFRFKILRRSSNIEFNNSLQAYLEQLKGIGLGRHKGNRTYDFNVEFEAKP